MGQVHVRNGQSRIQLDRSPQIAFGFRRPTQSGEDRGKADVGDHVLGIATDRLRISGGGLIQTSQLVQRAPHIIADRGIARIEPGRLSVMIERLLQPVGVTQAVPQSHLRLGIILGHRRCVPP